MCRFQLQNSKMPFFNYTFVPEIYGMAKVKSSGHVLRSLSPCKLSPLLFILCIRYIYLCLYVYRE